MRLSTEAKELKPSATLAINELVMKKRATGQSILHLGFGESPFPVHLSVQEELKKNVDKKSYLPTQGIYPLREKVSAFYKYHFNLDYLPEQIIVGPGSKVLVFDLLLSLEGPLFIPAPSWVSYQHQAKLMKKPVHYIRTIAQQSYLLSPNDLDEAFQKYSQQKQIQKILLLNYPNNPTGQSYDPSQLKELASVARDHNTIVISDEIYGLIRFHGNKHQSIAKFYPEGTIITSGISKDRSLGGFRLGVALLPSLEQELLKSMISIGSETWTATSAPIQYAAIKAYDISSEITNFISDCTAVHQLIATYVHKRIESANIRCPFPQGAFYLFPDWNKYTKKLSKMGINSSYDLAKTLIKKWNIATLPGSEFGMLDNDFCLRIANCDYDGSLVLNKFRENQKQAFNDPENFVKSFAPRISAACDQLTRFTESIK